VTAQPAALPGMADARASDDTRLRIGYALCSAALTAHVLLYGLGVTGAARGASFWIAGIPLAIGGLITAVLALTVTRWLPSVMRISPRWHPAIGAIGLAACVGFGIVARPEWVYAHGGLWLALTAAAAWTLTRTDAARALPARWLVVGAVVSVLAILGVRLYGLSIYPLMQISDEPWVLGWAISYARSGVISDPINAFGVYDPQQFMILPGLWVRAFGDDFWTARLFFFLLTLPLCVLTGLAARRLYDDTRVGWLAGIFMFASAVVIAGARIRHDVGLALAVAGALWAFAEGRARGHLWLHAAAGLLIGIGGFAHAHAVLFGLVLTPALYLPGVMTKERGVRSSVLAFIGGGLIGAALVFGLQFLPALLMPSVAPRGARTPETIARAIEMFGAYFGAIGTFSLIELALVLAAVGAALWRRGRIDLSIALAIVGLHLGLALVAAGVLIDSYLVTITPLYAIAAAALIVRGLRRGDALASDAQPRFALGIFTAAVMLGVTLAVPIAHLARRQPIALQPTAAMAWLRDTVPTDRSIVAQHEYYLFLTDHDFISPFSTSYMSPAEAAAFASEAAAWDSLAPDYVVIDRNKVVFCAAMAICQTDYLDSRGYTIVQTFPGEREPIFIYKRTPVEDAS